MIVAEGVAREFEPLPLDFALALVHLYSRRGDKRYERAALRYLDRYLTEATPSLDDLAGVAVLLVELASQPTSARSGQASVTARRMG